jgi:hypothetical protein
MPASHRHPALARLAERPWWLLLAAIAITIAVYAPGLSGGWLFDDYPNIVDNPGVQPHDADLGTLVRAALSSPSSEFKRPLASLSFAANYLAAGLDPYWMKLTNLVIHLLNGVAACVLAYALLRRFRERMAAGLAALIAGAWLLLPINLTGVLYVVQRMESMANLFVLVGLIGYVHARCRLQDAPVDGKGAWRYHLLCIASLVIPTGIGLLAKETAVMLPLYAALIEWIAFGFRDSEGRFDRKIGALFLLVLVLPLIVGVAWLLPGLLRPSTWATRDFTLTTRLLSEARIVTEYIGWTIVPSPEALSFYHDDFVPSSGWLHPWTTLPGLLVLAALFALALWWRHRRPLAALGILLFLGCHLLTGTILPLELVYEHRNYFASFGLLLALVPLLAAPRTDDQAPFGRSGPLPMALPRHVALGMLMLFWIAQTATSAYAWGDPLRLAAELADRAPASPRAQYELGRTYIIYSRYNPDSPFTALAYEPLERAMRLPESSILPEQALIFMNARMGLPLKTAWWDSMVAKLRAQKPGVQDESSLGALTSCQREMACDLPKERMVEVFQAALGHPSPNARLLATYSDYAWNVLGDHALGMRMIDAAVKAAPEEPAYRITQTRMLAALGRTEAARQAYRQLQRLNIGGRLDKDLAALRYLDVQPL